MIGHSATYLGNILVPSKNQTKAFSSLKERIHKRLEGWNNPYLSKAVLIKAVVQVIPTYTMTTFRLPSALYKEMDTAVKRFWWTTSSKSGMYLALKSWENICKPKDHAGLGFQKFGNYNMALISKLTWKLGSGEESLWAKVLRAKYLKGNSIFTHQIRKNASKVWKGIMAARSLIAKGFRFKIGDGFSIHDPWVHGIHNATPCLKNDSHRDMFSKVANFKMQGTRSWAEELIKSFIFEDDAQPILAMKWPTVICEDKLLWVGNPEGKFTVRNCYLLNFANEVERESQDGWSKLWKLDLHDRLKMFLWRLKAEVLPSKELISGRVGSGDRSCAICGADVETYFQLFKECHGIRAIAFASTWGCR